MSLNDVEWQITGASCVHIPGGEIIGFILHHKNFGSSPEGLRYAVYFTGDTVPIPKHREIAKKYHIIVILMNLGDASFPVAGPDEPLQITMVMEDATKLFRS
ncbi:hypothetical protein HJFPF1_05849 [Paramyrothecium foliicola]|nr:hypothetical protein HJFPF1_05849 [Paramyrothecium foliicola]